MKFNYKKNLIIFTIMSILLEPVVLAEGISGHIQKEDTKNTINKDIFTGEVETLNKKDTINLTVSQVLSSGYSVEGDEFFAEVSQDVESDKGVLLPTGTIAHGKIQYIQAPKNNGRDGYVTVDFDYLVTPDGRQIPINANFTTKPTPIKGAAKMVAYDTGYTLVGGVAGGLFALNTLGLGAAIASHGYTVAGGAAIGGVIGLTCAIIKKGNGFMIKPGDEFKIKITEPIDMPVLSPNAFRQEEQFLDGLNVRINSVKLEKDPFGVENTITLSLGIDNYTQYSFSTFDIALVSSTGEAFFPSPFGDTSLWFKTINPGEKQIGKLSFSIHDKKLKHWLVFYDRRSKKPLAKYSIDNAKIDIKLKEQNKKKKKQKK